MSDLVTRLCVQANGFSNLNFWIGHEPSLEETAIIADLREAADLIAAVELEQSLEHKAGLCEAAASYLCGPEGLREHPSQLHQRLLSTCKSMAPERTPSPDRGPALRGRRTEVTAAESPGRFPDPPAGGPD